MHTIMVLAGGFLLLSLCVLLGRLAGGSDEAMAKGAIAFLPLWLIGAAVNMWVGVAKAGYSVKEELPIFIVIFVVPAAVALVVLWRLKAS
jgi:hypothetical protein